MKPENLRLINRFINYHAVDYDIRVIVETGKTTFKPIAGIPGANYERAKFIASILQGAEAFTYWLERNKFKICK